MRSCTRSPSMAWVQAVMELCHGAAQVQRFLNAWIQGTDMIQYTPGGFAWSSPWGSLRYTANAALVAMVYAGHINGGPLSCASFLGLSGASRELRSNTLQRILWQHGLGCSMRGLLDSLMQTTGYPLFQEGGDVRSQQRS